VRFAFIDEEKTTWPVDTLCEVLGVPRSGFYAWKVRPPSPRAIEDAQLVVEIKAAHKAGRSAYGSPRVHRVLRRHGRRVGKKRVERLMRREGVAAKKRKKFCVTTDSRHADPIAPNVLQCDFDVALPNVAWVTDVTYVPTHEGWLYLAAILDLCSRRVVGWAASANNDRQLALDALARATSTRTTSAGLIHHSHRGSVYASGDYRDALDNVGAVPSMSQGRLLGQRRRRELLRDDQGGDGRPRGLPDESRRHRSDRGLHRCILQCEANALLDRLCESD
jgi:transposase InsO family protein